MLHQLRPDGKTPALGNNTKDKVSIIAADDNKTPFDQLMSGSGCVHHVTVQVSPLEADRDLEAHRDQQRLGRLKLRTTVRLHRRGGDTTQPFYNRLLRHATTATNGERTFFGFTM